MRSNISRTARKSAIDTDSPCVRDQQTLLSHQFGFIIEDISDAYVDLLSQYPIYTGAKP